MMRTRDSKFKAVLKAAVLLTGVLLFAGSLGFGQQTINLTVNPTTTTMPDGSIVPMWGYFCGTAVSGSTASCAALNPASVTTTNGVSTSTWSPVVITVPTGQALTINLTNNLSFTPTGSATANTVPTSIVIVGQVGGGLGNARSVTASPSHADAQGCATWFIASGATPPGVACPGPQAGASGTPPLQGSRVQSMAAEVLAGATAALTWPALKPGTYLLESGTHPSIQVPMGLIGMLVVTTAPSGTGTTAAAGIAYPAVGTAPAVTYNGELPLEFSEIDPVQNKAVDTAVRSPGFSEMNMRTAGDQVTAVTVTSGGSGYTSNPAVIISSPGSGAGAAGATATAIVGPVISSISVTNGGAGYTSVPAVTIGGTSFTPPAATAVMGLTFTVPAAGTGSGYIVGDRISFTGGGGAGASGTVTAVTSPAGAITAVRVNSSGLDYTVVPTAVVGGTGAVLTPALATTGAVTVAVTNGGIGYTAGDLLTFTGGTFTTAATGTVLTVGPTGNILTLNVSGGAYTVAPTSVTAGGSGAALTTTLAVSAVTVTNSGSGVSAPTVTIAAPVPPAGVTGVTALASPVTAGTPGAVYAINITSGGSRYSSAPSVTIAAGTTAATAVAAIGQSCTAGACYPSAVNYTPFYYLINGAAFNKTAPAVSLFSATAGTSTSGNGTCLITSTTPTCPVTTGITGTVLARIVNAGLRLHVPSIIGSLTNGFTGAGVATTTANPVSGFTLVAEDGNPVPGVQVGGAATAPAAPRVQTDVLMVPSKVFDVLINAPQAATAGGTVAALPIYDRQLSLSGNSSIRDAGMLAYISINNPLGSTTTGILPAVPGTGIFALAQANNDTYDALVAGQAFTVSDPSKGVIANDVNVYGVTLLAAPANGTVSCPAWGAVIGGTVSGMCANGTFTYTPNATSTATSDTFTYCANGTVTGTTCSSGIFATVTLGASGLAGNPSAIAQSYTAKTASYIKIPSPGLLIGNSDPNGLPMSVVTSTAPTVPGGTVVLDPKGGFTLSLSPAPTAATVASFSYTVQNSQGRTSAAGTVTVNFPAPSNLNVRVVDAQAYNNCVANNPNTNPSTCIAGLTAITDYRWIIEEDRTFYVDPNCTTNQSIATPGCPSIVGPAGQTTIPTFGVNFHASTMPYVAQGCTGPLSCEWGQTMYDARPACTGTNAAVCSPTAGQHIPAVCDLGNGACRPDLGNGTSSGGFTWVSPGSVHLDPTKRYYISVLPGDAANPFPSYAGQPGCSTTTGALPPPNANGVVTCGHTMSGAPIPAACNFLLPGGVCTPTSTTAFAPVTVLVLPTPLPTGKLSVMVFEDDFPLNGEQDSGGGVDTVSPNEPGLGEFNIVLWDTYGGLGDVTGQNSNDMFNQPLSNSLAGTIDPVTGLDACPISATPLSATGKGGLITGNGSGPATATAMTGMIVTCPRYEADQKTLSPLAGQAVIANLMPEKFSVQAYPGANRIARGEEWLQTNTLDGQHAHDSFIRIGEPSYFQEYGPAGYHVSIGFANPAIINARHAGVCSGAFGAVGACGNTITGEVDVQRQSRTPDQRLYASGSRDALTWTQCWVSLGDPDAEDFMFTKCDANGNFKFTGVPGGNWRLTIGDQWNDQIIDGLSTPANIGCVPDPTAHPPVTCTTAQNQQTVNMGHIGVQQWQSNIYTTTFIDDNKNGIKDPGEIGIPLIYTKVRYRDGHNANGLTTDFNGVANFNETFPLFNWYVVEADSLRYKTTGIHTVYDAGGPADGSTYCGPGNGARPCGNGATSNIATWPYAFLGNTFEAVPLPADLHVPGAVYCAAADCKAEAGGFAAGTANTSAVTNSTGRLDPPWVTGEAWSGMTSQGNWIEFGKAPFAACNAALPVSATNFCVSVPNAVTNTTGGGTTSATMLVGENGGIHGFVDYSSTRPFDSAEQMIEQPWEPYVPNVTINLYQEGFAADGVTPTLKMVDTTTTTSWDDWAQGFYPTSTAGTGTGIGQKPYMSCPGQGVAPVTTGTQPPNADLFYFTLFDQPNFLDVYNAQHNGATLHTLPYNSQYKCYDAMHVWNQLQPAPYDGKYQFPSSLGINPTTGKLLTTFGCVGNAAGTACPGASTATVTRSSMAGTNCTVCVANPDTTDVYRVGTPMLPPGKYVVEVIMPPGFEVYKEEDKNLLIGDNFIAPVTQQFGGLGTDIFIMPDQASVASLYDANGNGFNPTNYQDQTTQLDLQGGNLSGVPGFPGYQDPVWPCVGEQRVVPDYLSLFPQAKEVAPFAGATRPLCDRKEVILGNQLSVSAKFYIYTSTHIASKFTGVITDDFTSEFDPFAPQFGEKFAPPNQPISTKDYLGNEISRVYSDHFGLYNGLTFSSWEVNPPNITGYSPTMMVQCMDDPGPILDKNPSSPTYGQMINDPLYNSAYSNFCYEEPYMPGLTTYLDTPVVPTQAFVGAGYNNADCAYPDATPAIAEVDGDGVGPWVSAAGHSLTITALGNQTVGNNAYSGPAASVAPFDLKTITRHYGFGARCTAPSATSTTCNTTSSVTIGGAAAIITSWSDTSITVNVPGGLPGSPSVPLCTIQQQAQYVPTGTTQAHCGQLLITAGNGKQSIDAVTVTVGGNTPTHVAASGSVQSAIDAAAPGDLIIVDPTCTTTTAGVTSTVACTPITTTSTQKHSNGSHTELLLMWKPVRLQGVGAAGSVINANPIPAGKLLDPWRRHINCLFGLTLQGVPYGTTPYDSPTDTNNNGGPYTCPDTGWQHFSGTGQTTSTNSNPQVDRMPLEATIGWDATLNGNLAEQLQEPSLMGAYEGAGITVLAKGVEFHGASPWNDGTENGAFPTVATLLTGVVSNPGGAPGTANALLVGDANPLCHTVTYSSTGAVTITGPTNPYPSNYICNPSSIDGLSIINSSQGGGGIFVHGWAHFLQVANNRVYNNSGTLSGGISIGQGEFAGPYLMGSTTNAAPGSCSDGTGLLTNQHEPDCFQTHVSVHNNMISQNASLGDELFSATLSGGGGVSFCTGNDYYKFNFNWVCGNISTGEGGGLVHLGEIYNGDIEHNSFVLNQSANPTIPTNGGGIVVMGTPDTDPTCPGVPDTDCPPGLSDGTGPGTVINANLIQGNSADSGSGGGIRLQQVNGTEVGTFASQPTLWHSVTITNNIIANNLAGWDGAGISLQDALNVNIINNTIVHNDTLATSGVLTQSIGTPQASAPAGNCVMAGPTGTNTASCPQSAGLTSTPNSSLLTTAFGSLTVTCPSGHPGCTGFSNPILYNDIFWQNRSFYVGITGQGTGTNNQLNQQNVIGLFTASGSAAPAQTATGQCGTASYWDIGVRGDRSATTHESNFTLAPIWSLITAGYGTGQGNIDGNPTVVASYCNGSRVPPECSAANGCAGPHGFGVPPGIADSLTPNPVFSLVPSATVDEGNNWINVSWGPLSLANDSVTGGANGNYGGGLPLGNYSLTAGSAGVAAIPCPGNLAGRPCTPPGFATGITTPTTDFFGNPRPDGNGGFDMGAVEIPGH